MLLAPCIIELQVPARPFQVRIGEVNARGRARTTGGGVDRGAGRVAEEIQEAFTRSPLPDQRARRPMIEEQSGIEIVSEVDEKLQSALVDRDQLLLAGTSLVLVATPCAASSTQVNVIESNSKQLRQD